MNYDNIEERTDFILDAEAEIFHRLTESVSEYMSIYAEKFGQFGTNDVELWAEIDANSLVRRMAMMNVER